MSNTQAERVEVLAAQHGTRYVNRHFPDKASYGFSQEQLRTFAADLLADVGPTEDMLVAGMEASCVGRPSVDDPGYVLSIWNAMLAARNTTQQQGG